MASSSLLQQLNTCLMLVCRAETNCYCICYLLQGCVFVVLSSPPPAAAVSDCAQLINNHSSGPGVFKPAETTDGASGPLKGCVFGCETFWVVYRDQYTFEAVSTTAFFFLRPVYCCNVTRCSASIPRWVLHI